MMFSPVDLPQTFAHVVQDSHGVFPAIDQMRKDVSGVAVSSEALKSTPYARQCREETHEP